MSNEVIVNFDENILRLPSYLAVHSQIRKVPVKTIQQFDQLHTCGIIRKDENETVVLALAVYRNYLTTFDTVRFEIDDLIVDEKERHRGLGTRLFDYVIQQAKQCDATSILVHCDLTNTDAQRFFFRHGLTVITFEFYVKDNPILPSNDQIQVFDITDLPEKQNEKLLIQAHDIFRQLRPHLSTDQNTYINQIRDICRTGPARMIVAINHNENSAVLGLAIYHVTSNTKYSTHIYCDDLATNESNRSSGVGRCLINYMKNEGQKLGINQLTLDSGCQRGRAHKFYYREGFVINHFGFSKTI